MARILNPALLHAILVGAVSFANIRTAVLNHEDIRSAVEGKGAVFGKLMAFDNLSLYSDNRFTTGCTRIVYNKVQHAGDDKQCGNENDVYSSLFVV